MKKLLLLGTLALGCIPLAAQGQTVQGVKGVAVWFQARPVTDSLLNGRYHFSDKSGNSLILHAGTDTVEYTQHRDTINTFNFNPAIDLNAPSANLSTAFDHAGLQQATVIGVFAPKDTTLHTNVYQIDTSNRFTLHTEKVIHSTSADTLGYHPNMIDLMPNQMGAKHKTLPRIVSYTRTIMPSHSLWDAQETTLNLFKTFNGYCPEIMVFNRMLSIAERRKVETYLALKYGLTLLGSYYDSSGNLIWDINNNTFHHRVAGIGYDSSLSQLISTTSYENWANSANRDYETFFSHNSYNPTSRHRLLTIGREYGNSITSGKYMIWGDDNANLSYSGGSWHVMNRHWMICSSIVNKSDTITFVSNNLNVSGINHQYAVSGSGNDKYATIGPGSSGDKYFEFTCPSSTSLTYQVGLFEKDSAAVCTYGYQFENGQVKRVIDGNPQGSAIYTNCKGKKIRIYRRGDWMSLCVGNSFVNGSVIRVPSNDPITGGIVVRNNADSPDVIGDGGLIDPFDPDPNLIAPKQYQGILINKSTVNINLSDLRIGGFSDTGNIIELGYNTIANNQGPFNDSPQDTYLLISTSNNFTGSGVIRVRCDAVDTGRAKSIFRNINFPTGTCYFTFANGTPPTSSAKETLALDEEATDIASEESPVFGITSNGGSSREFTAWLDLPGSGEATLLLFDAAGCLYGEYSLNGSGRRTATFTINYPGVYIVKALTTEQEYTKKITVK